ncbi:MAG TPA: dephospho-CoA kinase [Clostridia bacterium]|nr:dephospho-CoA kinase [Clostridia bacterium]
MKQNSLKIIGLTGGIASGKSTVSNYLINKGYHVIDADIIAREVVAKGSRGLEKIATTFGKSILKENGSLNRKKLRNIVFNDEKALKQLEEITHPLIINKISEKLKNLRNNDRFSLVFLDCPLLFEMSLEALVNEVWLISTTTANQISRIVERDKTDPLEAKKIIEQQMSLKEKIKKSDIIIKNNSTIEELKSKIDLLLKDRC